MAATYKPDGAKGFPCPMCGTYLDFVKQKDGRSIHDRRFQRLARHLETECTAYRLKRKEAAL